MSEWIPTYIGHPILNQMAQSWAPEWIPTYIGCQFNIQIAQRWTPEWIPTYIGCQINQEFSYELDTVTRDHEGCGRQRREQTQKVQAESVKVDAGELVLQRRRNERRSGESR
ncbi:hypothetical protein IGI04_000921 [Brassica rapa subsp. trilocularis]|uniref:Aminotransferase-like plant mobile domain-containing protein n=1 Tax=Brassica rapa subsp. trilocularis TaxID=1813537 RepID=A0ABQ7NUG9_BRACM|nr:hypothetical protein IGI04_000921 [Brassica rapa subsp. trilocularis]